MPAQLAAFGIVVDDMARSLAFYRELGIDLPPEADGQPHAQTAVSGGLQLMFDTVDEIRSFDPDWQPPPNGLHRMELAFQVDTPAEVDTLYASSPRSATTGTSSRGTPSGASAMPSCTTPTATVCLCFARTREPGRLRVGSLA